MGRLITLLGLIFTLVGCGAGNFVLFNDAAIRKGMDNGQIRIGSSKAEVASVVDPSCIKRKIKEDGSYELWDFESRGCGANLTQSYALIFKNDTLVEIRTVSNILDLQF